MSTLITNSLQLDSDRPPVPLSELGYRIIKDFRQRHTAGEWNPNDTFNWVPGMFNDYTPLREDSRIRVYCTIPQASRNAAHAIAHWIFFANGVEIGRHNVSGNHYEDNCQYTWDFESWGTTQGRIGYQMRSYANDNNEQRVYSSRYWDGSGSAQNFFGHFQIEEYISQGVL